MTYEHITSESEDTMSRKTACTPVTHLLPRKGERILAEGVFVRNDAHSTGLNNNDLIIGTSGSGKTRSYVKPNLLACEGSFIVADTKGELYGSLRCSLERRGYEVQLLDLVNMAHSPWGYNPLSHIRFDGAAGRYSQQDIMSVVAALCPEERVDDPFWDNSCRLQLSALVGYVLEALPPDERHLGSVAALLAIMNEGKKGISLLNLLFSERGYIDSQSFAAQKWKMARGVQEADRTQSCIQGFIAEKLDHFAYDAPLHLFTCERQVDFARMGSTKVALFINVSDVDRSMDRLTNLLYLQALQSLCRAADAESDRRLGVPVRIVLDDFASNVTIPDFDRIVSVVRSREISVSIIIQSLSQLEAMYGKPRAATIVNNCDHMLYLGGQDVETAQFIGMKANRAASTILAMPVDGAYLFERGATPHQVSKFDLDLHERQLQCEAESEATPRVNGERPAVRGARGIAPEDCAEPVKDPSGREAA